MTDEWAYRTLEVEPGASPEEIRRAWLDLCKVWHPDRFAHDARLAERAGRKLQEVNRAYQRLSTRATAQAAGADTPGQAPPSPPPPPPPTTSPGGNDAAPASTKSNAVPFSWRSVSKSAFLWWFAITAVIHPRSGFVALLGRSQVSLEDLAVAVVEIVVGGALSGALYGWITTQLMRWMPPVVAGLLTLPAVVAVVWPLVLIAGRSTERAPSAPAQRVVPARAESAPGSEPHQTAPTLVPAGDPMPAMIADRQPRQLPADQVPRIHVQGGVNTSYGYAPLSLSVTNNSDWYITKIVASVFVENQDRIYHLSPGEFGISLFPLAPGGVEMFNTTEQIFVPFDSGSPRWRVQQIIGYPGPAATRVPPAMGAAPYVGPTGNVTKNTPGGVGVGTRYEPTSPPIAFYAPRRRPAETVPPAWMFPSPRPPQLEDAVRAYRQYRLAEAEATVRSVIATDKGSAAAARNLLGTIHATRGDYAAAVGHYEDAVRGDSRHAVAWRNLAFARMARGDYTVAADACRKASALDSGFEAQCSRVASACARNGQERRRRGDYGSAAACAQAACALDEAAVDQYGMKACQAVEELRGYLGVESCSCLPSLPWLP